MEKTKSALDCLKQFVKEGNGASLKCISKYEYKIVCGEFVFIAMLHGEDKQLLTLEYDALSVTGVSHRRIDKICDFFCSEYLRVMPLGNIIDFRYESPVFSHQDVRVVISILLDNVRCFREEVDTQTFGMGIVEDLNIKRANQERAKKEMEEQPEYMSRFDFRKNSDGEGFNKVAGMDDLKKMLHRDFIDVIKNPKLAKIYGIIPPNGILLYGPPGCGKTFIAERLTEEVAMTYAIIKPSDLGSTLIHGSTGMISELFENAKERKNCLLIMDEFDALVPARGSEDARFRSEEINEFLVQLNKCAERGIYVVATSNHPEKIDKAVLRKGRIDRCIYVPMPDKDTRAMLFALELYNRPTGEDVNVYELAKLTKGYTSSDITYIVDETARRCFASTLLTKSHRKKKISQEELKTTIEKTTPSVSSDDLARYSKIQEELNDRNMIMNGRKIGFEQNTN